MTKTSRQAKRILSVQVCKLYDSDPDLSWLDPDDDADRLDAYARDVWCMVGVRARAEVTIGGVTQQVFSAGIWNVESDSGKEYFEQLREQELDQLAEVLRDMRFGARQVKAALDGADWSDD